jgi:hypothetical protein
MSRFLQDILDTPIFAFDQLAAFSGVRTFLDFSERNIEQRRQSIVADIDAEMEDIKIGDEHWEDYREHKIRSAEFQYNVVLPMRVRYAALTAFISTIEWSMKVIRPSFTMPRKPSRTSETVHLLREYAARCDLDLTDRIKCLDFLIWVRNSIMHNAGVLKGYTYERDIRGAIGRFEPNFTISNWHHIGDTVEIKRGALEPLIDSWSETIRQLYTAAYKKELLQF